MIDGHRQRRDVAVGQVVPVADGVEHDEVGEGLARQRGPEALEERRVSGRGGEQRVERREGPAEEEEGRGRGGALGVQFCELVVGHLFWGWSQCGVFWRGGRDDGDLKRKT